MNPNYAMKPSYENKRRLEAFPPLNTPWQKRNLNLRKTVGELQGIADEVQRFCNKYLLKLCNEEKLILCGENGNGKTTMARGIHQWASHIGFYAWESGFWKVQPSAGFHRWQQVCDDLESGRSFRQVLDPIIADQLIVLDDLGADSDRYRSGKALDALSCLLSETEKGHWLVVTMNFHPDLWRERFDARSEDRLLRDALMCDFSKVPSWSKL